MNISATSVTERSINIDILKTIGLLAIILAHVETGNIIFQLRNFDVPLMVMCSGILFAFTSGREIKYSAYINKRLMRLVIPSWIFLSLYFSIILLVDWLLGRSYLYGPSMIAQEFFLRSRVVGLWIIRVFIYVALIAPFLLFLKRKLGNINLFLVSMLFFYLIYELLFLFSVTFLPDFASKVLSKSLFELIPYGCVFGLGMAICRMNKKTIILLSMVFGGVFLIAAASNFHFHKEIWTQADKYPPRVYYLSYAIAVSTLLYSIFRDVNNVPEPYRRIIIFFSTSSLWIYLWHWLFLYYASDVINSITMDYMDNIVLVLLTYFFIIFASIAITYLQKRFFSYVISICKNSSPYFQRIIQIAFL